MAERRTIEEMRALAAQKAGRCLSKEYVNSKTKLRWCCSKGHEWEAIPNAISRGVWCPRCAGVAKLSIGEMRSLARQRGGQCLSTEYVNNRSKLLWRCSQGHEWEAVANAVKSGKWCPYCAGKAKLTIQGMKELARRRGGRCLSTEYIDSHTKLSWRCKKRHEWDATPNNVKSGCWCPRCAATTRAVKQKRSIEDMREIAAQMGGRCLSRKYVNNHTKLRWRCAAGHEWTGIPLNVRKGEWCPKCGAARAADKRRSSIEVMRALASGRGGECLSEKYVNSGKKLRWRCGEGHEWEATPRDVKAGSWCPECSHGMSERACRVTFERMFETQFPRRKPEWLVNSRGNRMELDGYSEKLGIAFEYHGRQHYRYVPFFHRQDGALANRRRDDRRKARLCLRHGVVLVEVPYTLPLLEIQEYVYQECIRNGVSAKRRSKLKLDDLGVYSRGLVERMHVLARSRGGECLSTVYFGRHTKLRWRCAEGHEWEARPGDVARGQWCPKCGVARRASKRRLTIEMMRSLAEAKGGRCLSPAYLGNHTKLRWLCKKGHEWEAAPKSVKSGSWCPRCAVTAGAVKQSGSIEDMREVAAQRGGKCLSRKYANNKTKLRWRCAEGHEWKATPSNIRSRGAWCPTCARKGRQGVPRR